MREQRTLFDLTQDGLVIGTNVQRIYPAFDVSGFVSDVRTEMEGQTINDTFRFSFSLQSESDAAQTILTYYAVAYKRPTGHITRKRYRLSQRKLKPRQRVDWEWNTK